MEKLSAITSTSNTFNCFTSPVLQTPSSFWKFPRINSSNSHLPLVSDYFDDPGKINSIHLVNQLNAQVIKLPQMGYSDEISQVLITSYLKFQDFESALMVFFLGFRRNFVVWKSFLEEFKSFGGNPIEILEGFCELYRKGVEFDSKILTVVLKICAILMSKWLGVEIHASLIKRGFDTDVYLKSALMYFYGRCWGTGYADKVFDEMPERGVALWNEAIVAAIQNENYTKALQYFQEMQFMSVKADTFTISKAIQACAKGRAIDEGRQIHGYMFRNDMEKDLAICNSLINMYAKNNMVELARKVFDSMDNCSLSSWNTMISAYASVGFFDDAMELFHRMEFHNVEPDIVTWNSLLSSHLQHGLYHQVLNILRNMLAKLQPNSSSITPAIQAINELNWIKLGKEMHCYVLKNGLHCDLYVQTTLLDMYVKNGELVKARALFDLMKTRNIVAWNSLISGYSSNGLFDDAVRLLNQMEEEDINPDMMTLNSLLSGYLVNGRIEDALAVVAKMKILGMEPNVVSWTALISGMSWLQKGKEIHSWCLRNGFDEDVLVATALMQMYIKSGTYNHGEEGIMLFKEMRDLGIHPDAITFTALLSCCKNSGRAGYLDEAWDFIKTMPVEPDASVWGSLLQSCRVHNNLKLGKIAAKNLFELEPKNSANYVILMNLYSMSSRWEDVDRVREEMTARELRIQFGWSWIEIYRKVHIFNDEKLHPDTGNIYFELYHLISEMKKAGYIPDIKSVYQDIDDAEKEKVLLSHTEKLAITYGLLKMKDDSPIRVIKSTRMCSDCHTAAKFFSVLRKREIILKDGVRFHHFREGRCSCNDHW
uniref:DYW domain-containing protein n=1 Tax=Chenopodium quinoa TaxID=63459 RepID=A0A803KZL0_CHEQI